MSEVYERLNKCLSAVRSKTDFIPKLAIVLGSGLGDFADTIKAKAVIDYSDIEGFPVSTVAGHKGRFVFGYIGAVPVVAMQGRVHYYEGYSMQEAVLPIRLMGMLGAEVLMVTNASGGINKNFSAGDLMLITDHISSFIPSPLIGENVSELGVRFPDMTEAYDKKLRNIIMDTASREGIELKQGVYIQFAGPQFETPAEIRMARSLGADAVGMSTVCEVIAARHMGMKVCGISCVSNMAAGMTGGAPLKHEDVQKYADEAAPRFQKLVKSSILEIAKRIH